MIIIMTQMIFKSFIRNKKTIFLTLTMLLLLPFFVAGLVTLGVQVAYGQLPGGAIGVFGGQLLDQIQCTCNGGHVMVIGPPSDARVRKVPQTRVFEYGQTKKIGAWQLGIYDSPTVCLKKRGVRCRKVPHQGNIMIIGTSR